MSVVVETWNTKGDVPTLARQLDRLAPQISALDAELVVTYVDLSAGTRETLEQRHGRRIHWVQLDGRAGYYDHKNAGFDATTGNVVAFIDGDCEPSEGWLAALVAPFSNHAQVVAGATSYDGVLAPLANELDFPYFEYADKRRSFAATSAKTAPEVRNFFANNVAFAREAFASRRYPTIEPMFHGQCQVLALRFMEAGIPIAYAPDARVTHAWPDDLREFLEVRLLRGADTTQLLPHVLGTYAPRTRSTVEKLGPLPALAIFAMRAVTGALSAMRRGPVVRGLALVAAVTAIDAIGAVAAPAVYRWVA
ncbi:MAG TPA: glycosyltransferase [Kofleriaceae bacterium]|nr:glycosyltransferase [Kofleriaceae bacterium]